MSIDCVQGAVNSVQPSFGKKSKISGKEIPKGYSETKSGNFYKKEHTVANTCLWGGVVLPFIYDVFKSKGMKGLIERMKIFDPSLASLNMKVSIATMAAWCVGLIIDHSVNKKRATVADKIASDSASEK